MADWGNIAEIATAAATSLAVVVAIVAIRAKRSDDRRADRLDRINRQLSQLYGKLSIHNEAGVRHWNSFIDRYGNDNRALGKGFMRFFPYKEIEEEPITGFNPPPPDAEQMAAYREWLTNLFMQTNEAILAVIYANADLVIGATMPEVLVAFAEHVASLRMLLLRIQEAERKAESRFLDDWEEHTKLMAPHPTGIGHYINACFEILKEEQEKLLSTTDEPCTEKEIAKRIQRRIWERQVHWAEKEHRTRAAVGQHYEYREISEPVYD